MPDEFGGLAVDELPAKDEFGGELVPLVDEFGGLLAGAPDPRNAVVEGPEAMNQADLFFETFKQHLAEEPKLPPFFENQFNIPVPPVDRVRAVAPYLPGSETIAEAVTGTLETVLPAVSSMTSPAMITAVAAMGSGGVAAKLAAGGFAGIGAKAFIEGVPEFVKAVKEGDVQGAFRHGSGLVMSGGMMLGGVGPKFNSVPRPAARAGEVPPVLPGVEAASEPVKFAQEAIAKASEVAPLTAKALEEAVAPVGTELPTVSIEPFAEAVPAGPKEAPVTYAGFQQGFGKIPGKDIYTLTEDLPGTKFVKNDTVTANDLKSAGFEIPESARPPTVEAAESSVGAITASEFIDKLSSEGFAESPPKGVQVRDAWEKAIEQGNSGLLPVEQLVKGINEAEVTFNPQSSSVTVHVSGFGTDLGVGSDIGVKTETVTVSFAEDGALRMFATNGKEPRLLKFAIDKAVDILNGPAPKEAVSGTKLVTGETVTPKTATAEIRAEVADVAKTEGMRPAKEVKAELVARLEKAIEEAPTAMELADNPNRADIREVTIEIPGDGTFTMRNTKENLTELLGRAKRIQTTSQAPVPNAFRKTRPTGDFPADVWVESSEPTHTVTVFAKEKGKTVDIERKGRPIEVKGYEGKELFLTSDGKTFAITEPKTGQAIGFGDTISKAVKDAETKDVKGRFDEAVSRGVDEHGKRPAPKPFKPEGGETQGAIATAGPALMPAMPAGAPLTPVKAISEIVRDLAKGLDIPIRFGRLTTSKYAGYFKKNPNLIGAKFANDMPIVAHEVGHKLDAAYPFTSDASLRPELDALGDPAIAGSRSSWTPSKSAKYKRSEGFAEFVRHWLTDPAEAQRLAPATHTMFQRILEANEDMASVIRQAQADIQLWRNAPQEARLDSSISRSDPNKARYSLPNLMRDVVDDLHFLRMAVDDAKVSGPVASSENPYQLARSLRGSYGMADTFIRKGVVDFKTREVKMGTDLNSALEPVAGRMNEFRRWIVAKRAQELRSQGRETGLNSADVDFVADKYGKDATFQEAFTKVKAWNDALLKYTEDSGMVSPESAALIREMNQDYVPFHRVFEVGAGESPAVSGGGSGRGLNVGTPGSLKRLKGSQRDIVDPLETMIKNAYTLITASEKNAINTALADLAPKSNMGRWVERVAIPKELVRVEAERMREQLENAGADMANVPDDLVVSFFRPSRQAPFGENIIKVNRGGQLEFYRLDKDLFETFHSLDMDSSSRLLKILSAPAQVLRAGVTLTPDFALMNAMRDTVSAAVISKYTSFPFQSTIRGMAALLNNPKLVAEWAASGGKQSVEANYFDRAKLQKFITEKITKDLTKAEQATVWLKSPLTAARMFTGAFEEATRLGEYKAAFNKLTKEGMAPGDARRQAAFEARDLQDFAKGGAQTKIVRSLAAFWNAGLQGEVRMVQAFKERPFQTTLKGLAFITIPKLLEQALNWNDEDYWDRPQWERDLMFLIPRGKDENGHTKFLRIPTPFTLGLIFGTVPGRVLQAWREQDPKAMASLPRLMLTQTIPNPMPQAVMTMIEAGAGKQGYSFFRGRPIVPSSLESAPPEMQFTEQNSLTAKKVGKLLGMAPAKIDYVISGIGGGVAKQLTHQVSDRAISAATGEQRTAKGTMPGARFIATPAGIQSEAVERFYKRLELANADQERVKAGMPAKGEATIAADLNVAARAIAELRKEARAEKDEVKRQATLLKIVAIAKNPIPKMKTAAEVQQELEALRRQRLAR